jgi:hypothetical protein
MTAKLNKSNPDLSESDIIRYYTTFKVFYDEFTKEKRSIVNHDLNRTGAITKKQRGIYFEEPFRYFRKSEMEYLLVDNNYFSFILKLRYARVLETMFERDPYRKRVRPYVTSLSHKDVATLYLAGIIEEIRYAKKGKKKLQELSESMASKLNIDPVSVSHEFARGLTRELKKHNIDKDAIVTSKHGKGYMLGNGWHKKRPLMSKAQISKTKEPINYYNYYLTYGPQEDVQDKLNDEIDRKYKK